LLILDVHAPATASITVETLRPLLPQVATFMLSFVIVGVYWVAHHHMLHFIRQVDRQLLWLNLLLLLCVVFIPFPTSLLGKGSTNPLVVRLYGCTLIADRSPRARLSAGALGKHRNSARPSSCVCYPRPEIGPKSISGDPQSTNQMLEDWKS
jgi:hypothetical protein